MENSRVWFSHREYRYDAELKGNQRVFSWSNDTDIWDWDNCTVSAVNRPDNKIRIVIQSTNTIQSKYRKSIVELKYMLGFDVTNVHEPKTEDYHEPRKHNVKNEKYGPRRPRWVLQLDEDYWIWEWVEQGRRIESSTVYQIYEMIKKKLDTPDFSKSSIFNIATHDDRRIIPVIYQPAIDSWKNFVREVYCHKCGSNEFEVTILFNNEELREHAILNKIYEWFRSLVYRRIIDVETFRIILEQEVAESFKFEGIYSGENDMQQDDVHGDKPGLNGNVPIRKIKYYFANTRHPIVFINTSNHAMAEHDTNHKLWKWEYIAWKKNSPIVYGEKSRQQIDRSFRPKLKFW